MADVASMRIHQHHKPTTIIRLNDDDFIEVAGLDRSGKSGRKSSVERLLGNTLLDLPTSNNFSHAKIRDEPFK